MSDEIPVGSPPVPPGRHAAPGGWYPDPAHQGHERYWDGWQWTRNVREATQPAPQGFGQPGPGQPGFGPSDRGGQGWGQPGQQQQNWGSYPGTPGPYGQAYPGMRVAPHTEDGVPLAPYGWRVLAYLIDTFVVSVLSGIVTAITGLAAKTQDQMAAYMQYVQEAVQGGQQLDIAQMVGILYTPERVMLNVVTALIFVVYSALMLRRSGATLGKLACGLRVVPNGRGQHRGGLTWRESLIRPVAGQVMDQIPLLGLINLLFPLWDKRKQTLHDKVARTQVVKIR